MYLLRLTCKPTSKFERLLEDVRAYAAPHNRHRFLLADWQPSLREVLVILYNYPHDAEYLVRDLSINDPSHGAYNRLAGAMLTHVTNDPDCDCTPCMEGGLDMLFHMGLKETAL